MSDDTERNLAAQAAELEELRAQSASLEDEVVGLRRRLQDAPKRVRTLEERLLETKGQLAQAVSQNEKLTYTLREAREQGQVAHSKDFTQTFLILAIFGYLLASAGHIVETLGQMILLPGTLLRLGFNEAANTLIQELLKQAAWIVLPFIGIVLGAGIFADALQVGVLFAFEKLKPSAKKLNVLSNLKNIFSKKNLVEFLKSAIKIAFLSTLLTLLIRDALPIMTSIPQAGLAGLGALAGRGAVGRRGRSFRLTSSSRYIVTTLKPARSVSNSSCTRKAARTRRSASPW